MGFGMILTVFFILLYPVYVKKGYRFFWALWICYPLGLFFAVSFGFFLTHYPLGGCIWMAGWTGYMIGANLIYNVLLNLIISSTTWLFWIESICSAVGLAYLVWKIKREDKTYHLIWLTPVIGGYLCALSFLLLSQTSPSS